MSSQFVDKRLTPIRKEPRAGASCSSTSGGVAPYAQDERIIRISPFVLSHGPLDLDGFAGMTE